jgi:hypothetical protein
MKKFLSLSAAVVTATALLSGCVGATTDVDYSGYKQFIESRGFTNPIFLENVLFIPAKYRDKIPMFAADFGNCNVKIAVVNSDWSAHSPFAILISKYGYIPTWLVVPSADALRRQPTGSIGATIALFDGDTNASQSVLYDFTHCFE